MTFQQLATGLLVLGLSLVVVSVVWKEIVPQSAIYSESEAHALQQAATAYHRRAFEKEGPTGEAAKQAQAEYEQAQQSLDEARSRFDTVPTYLRWSGFACCGISMIGLVIHFSLNRS